MALATHDLGGRGPTLVMAHATGFHGLVLGPLARALAPHLACIAFDARGHGATVLPPGAVLDWYGLAADAAAVADAAAAMAGHGSDGHPGARPLGFGHSSGATALLLAEQARPGTFAGLYCYEPVLVAADPPLGRDPESWLAEAARRRRRHFASRLDALAHLRSRPALGGLHPDALRAYVDHGLAEEPDGTVALRCGPEVEAALYETATAHDAWPRLGEVTCPVTVGWGSASDAGDPGAAEDHARRLGRGRAVVLDGLGHLGPLEAPEAVAASVTQALLSPAPGP